MDKSSLVKFVKEKGPIFAIGMVAGALIVAVIINRNKIEQALATTLKSLVQKNN